MARWTEKLAGGPQAIRSEPPPPLARMVEVGRQQHFWDSFIIVLSVIPKQDSICIGSDMNGHVGRDADGYGGVHGGMGFGDATHSSRRKTQS